MNFIDRLNQENEDEEMDIENVQEVLNSLQELTNNLYAHQNKPDLEDAKKAIESYTDALITAADKLYNTFQRKFTPKQIYNLIIEMIHKIPG